VQDTHQEASRADDSISYPLTMQLFETPRYGMIHPHDLENSVQHTNKNQSTTVRGMFQAFIAEYEEAREPPESFTA